MTLEFAGNPTPLTPEDYLHTAQALNIDLAALYAVTEVESSGKGYLADGRPRILYEAHIFSALTKGRFNKTAPRLSSPTWNRALYGKAGAHQYDRLLTAMELDRDAALQSASWGLFQILGRNYREAGFDNVEDFVTAHVDGGEAAHLHAFANFVLSSRAMRDAITRRDWSRFARYYNGPRYAENQYHTKLAAAYATHKQRLPIYT